MLMRRSLGFICLLGSLLLNPLAHADTAAIHTDALPQDPAVLDALHDAVDMEPYSRYWTSPWNHPVAQREVAGHLGKDLHALQTALKTHPGNPELLLLTSLVATYAYNLDVKGSDEAVLADLAEASQLAPGDLRRSWFHAAFLCGTTQSVSGAQEFLTLENQHPWNELPVGFWDDYMHCAAVTQMPSHALRAADHLEHLQAPASSYRSRLTEIVRNHFLVFDPMKEFQPTEAWSAIESGDSVEFTSVACGVRLRVPRTWAVERVDFSNGSCVAQFRTGSYTAGSESWSPNVLLLVQRATGGASLQEWSQRFLTKGTFTPFTPSRCPADSCLAMQGDQPGVYREGGGGHPRIVFFQRDPPLFPGLLFESPSPLRHLQERRAPSTITPVQRSDAFPVS